MKTFQHVIEGTQGIHARLAVLIAQIAAKYKSAITLECGGKTAVANNALEIMTLHAGKGQLLTVMADGDDEDVCIEKMKEVLL